MPWLANNVFNVQGNLSVSKTSTTCGSRRYLPWLHQSMSTHPFAASVNTLPVACPFLVSSAQD